MFQFTVSEKCLAGALLLSILIGISVHHYRHSGGGHPQAAPAVAEER